METRTITFNVYDFDELSETAKEKARDYFRQYVFQDECDYDYILEDAIEIAALMGITIPENGIEFSGFSSQGDGARFTGKYVYKADAVKRIKEYAPKDNHLHSIVEKLETWKQEHGEIDKSINMKIVISDRYPHSNSMMLDSWEFGDERDDNFIESGEAEPIKIFREFADWIYDRLETEYNYRLSDESILETIEANDYKFLDDGSIA